MTPPPESAPTGPAASTTGPQRALAPSSTTPDLRTVADNPSSLLHLIRIAADARDLCRLERDRLAILSSANSRIGSSLDMDRTALELAEVVVPRFADRVQVRLLDSVGDPGFPIGRQSPDRPIRLRRVVTHPVGRDRAALAGPVPVACVRPGTALHEILLAFSARLVPQREVEQVDGSSMAHRIVAPLSARGVLLGVATFSRDMANPAFTGADLEVAEELAARTAICVENGRLYHRERSTALMLQRSLLPERIPEVDAVEVAFRYRPGPVGAEVGGDWFDVIPLPGSRVAFVVGDVMGSGLRAAGTMGQFRTAVRTLAQLDLSPAAVLRELDILAQSMSESHIATCVYAVYDPVDGQCVTASAGHLPPLLVRRDGTVSVLELPIGAPLGVGAARFEELEFNVQPTATLVLYTDGLVEDRYQDIDVGIGALAELVGKAEYTHGPGSSLEGLSDLVFQQLSDPHRLDDATLLLATLDRLPGDRVAGWTLTTMPTIAAQSRALVRGQLDLWSLGDLADVAELLVSELVTNALRYGRGEIGLRMLRGARSLVCEISDGQESAPKLRTVHYSDEGGRGLYLVDQLSLRWGTRATSHGKIVWFELAI
jgi:serine phosphatase RsbU (regulator of sigma subunit)